MAKSEKYKHIPHFESIQENTTIHIPSLFMFQSNEELYPFLHVCKEYNCTVIFDNENLIIEPTNDVMTSLKLFSYTTVMNCREIGDAYIRYLGNLAKMQWVDNTKETIIKEYK